MKKNLKTKSSIKTDKSSKLAVKTSTKAPVKLLVKAKTLLNRVVAKTVAKTVSKPQSEKPSAPKLVATRMAPKTAKKAQVKTKPFKAGSKVVGPTRPDKTVKAAQGAKPLHIKQAPTKPVAHAKAPVLLKGQAKETSKAPADLKAAGKAGAKVKASGKSGSSEISFEKMCRETACENAATTKGYCRLDYIKNWKKIKRKEMILKEGKLNQYIEELVGKYPDKYIDVIRQDLSTEVNFNKVIHDLELDESIDDLDYDGDSIDALIGGIKKEGEGFDDTDF